MATDVQQPKGSPFMSLFHRKKKINQTVSHDDIKTQQVIKDKEKQTKHSSLEKKKKSKSSEKSFWNTKSHSLDDVCEEDANTLVEALETIAAEQPMVARSIPKHAKVTKKEDKSMENCLFEQQVYDSMLSDSLKVCDLLQSHLDDCIISVRTKSPEPHDTSQDCHDSGRGGSSASSTLSASPNTQKKLLKSCIRADV